MAATKGRRLVTDGSRPRPAQVMVMAPSGARHSRNHQCKLFGGSYPPLAAVTGARAPLHNVQRTTPQRSCRMPLTPALLAGGHRTRAQAIAVAPTTSPTSPSDDLAADLGPSESILLFKRQPNRIADTERLSDGLSLRLNPRVEPAL